MFMLYYCFFINNCVGLNNFVYFYLFLLYCCLGFIFVVYCIYIFFMVCMLNYVFFYRVGMCNEFGDYVVMFIVVSFLLVFIFMMFCFYIFFFIVDMLMIDFLKIFQKLICKDWLKIILIDRCLCRKKLFLRKLLLYRRERWWKFFILGFNEIFEFFFSDEFLV